MYGIFHSLAMDQVEMCILASGSSGNCTVLRTPGGTMLMDAGLGPRSILSRLAIAGVQLAEIRAICLTHLDSDHFRPAWLKTIVKWGIHLWCHQRCVRELLRMDRQHRERTPQYAHLLHGFDDQPFSPLDGLRFDAIPLAHDEAGTHGFVIEGYGCRIGYATDLGHVPDELIERFCGLDVLAIESNYDPHMQRTSGRPWFLQQRIMGGRGHLSNEQCFDAVRRILDQDEQIGRLPRHVVLLHRSRQCNCPNLVRTLFHRDERLRTRLVLTDQFTPTDWLAAGRGEEFPTSLFKLPLAAAR